MLARKTRRVRVGWPERDVPTSLAGLVEASDSKPGWKTLLLPIVGPDAVALQEGMRFWRRMWRFSLRRASALDD